ncbi:MAG: hypothetical protein ACKVOU_11195 [Cytophagales bacterium]
MKAAIITLVSFIVLASACAPQRTCPTYLKNKTNAIEKVKNV